MWPLLDCKISFLAVEIPLTCSPGGVCPGFHGGTLPFPVPSNSGHLPLPSPILPSRRAALRLSLSPTCQHYQRLPSSSQSCFLDSALSHPLPDFFLCSVATCTLPNFAAFRYSVCPAAHGTFIEGTFFNVVRTRVPSLGDYRTFFYVDCFLSLKSMLPCLAGWFCYQF